MPLLDTTWPKTIPCSTIKWHFSKFSTRLVSMHLCSTLDRLAKHESKEELYAHDAPLEGTRDIAEAEGHPSISKGAEGTGKCGLLLILWCNVDLEVSSVAIQKVIMGLTN